MLVEQDLQFVRQQIENPQIQTNEEVASESHETRRIPDPYVYVNRGGKLATPKGALVEENIDKSSPVGRVEAEGFDRIQDWSSEVTEGFSVWFSPTHPVKYPETKLIIQEVGVLDDNIKFVLNRAVVLDEDDDYLLKSASELAGSEFEDKDTLRATPVFPEREIFIDWFEGLSEHIEQIQMIKSGEDLTTKSETYASLNDIVQTIPVIEGSAIVYEAVYQRAKKEELIGDFQGSCPPALKTAFERVFDNSFVLNQDAGDGKGPLTFSCHLCGEKNTRPFGGYVPNCKGCGGDLKCK